jgi:hypothetical protein
MFFIIVVLTALGLVLNLRSTKGPYCDTVVAGESDKKKFLKKPMRKYLDFFHRFLAPVYAKQTYLKPIKCNKLY